MENELNQKPEAEADTETTEAIERPKLNPWISTWTKPTATMEQTVENTPKATMLFLAVIGGIPTILGKISSKTGPEYSLAWKVLIASVVGAAAGIIMLEVWSIVLTWITKLFGGTVERKKLKAALAWPNVIVMVHLATTFILIAFMGAAYFDVASTIRMGGGNISSLYKILFPVRFVLSLWAAVIGIKCISVVQKFTIGKTILSIILASAIIEIPIWLISLRIVGMLL